MNEETLQVMFSSKNQKCQTPKSFFHMLDAEFYFTTDVGADKESALKPDYLGLDNGRDALKTGWGSVDYCNPPYGRQVGQWTRRGYEQSHTWTALDDPVSLARMLAHKVVVMLLPGRIDTKWFKDWVFGKASEVRIVSGRLKFDIGPHDHKKAGIIGCTERHPAPFPSIVVVYDERTFTGTTKWSIIEKPEGE